MTAPTEPPTGAADLADRALVGALLWDPDRVRDVRDWLQPDDLGHWKSRTIYQTLIGLERDGHRTQVTDLPEIIAAGTYHDASPRGAVTAVDLHTYMKATPATPAASEQFPQQRVRSDHVRYGRIVLEASARALVAAAGSRIQQAAQQAREQPDVGSQSIEASLTEAQQRLGELGDRLRTAHGTGSGRIAAALGGPVADRSKLSGGRDDAAADEVTQAPGRGGGAPLPPLTTRAVIEAEHEVLAACLTNPTARTELLGWLTPEDFSRPDLAATWQAYGSLAAAGAPVDYVTVAWECERLGGDSGLAGLAPEQLTRMAEQTPRDPGPAVETVAHAALVRHTETAHDTVQSVSADRGSDALTVVSAAERAYRDVADHARRLSGSPAAGRPGSTLNRSINDTGPQPRWPTQPPPRPPDDPPGRSPHRGR